jgi:hypothetical protein
MQAAAFTAANAKEFARISPAALQVLAADSWHWSFIRTTDTRLTPSVVSHKYLYKELARDLLAQKIIPRSRWRLRSTMICLLHALSSYFRDTTLE